MKWDYNFQDCSNMFNGVNGMTEVDFTYFDSSIVNNMYNMFQHCTSLTSINFKNFDTSSVIKMSFMFDTCIKLTSIDLSGFITTSVKDINAMFDDCWSLKQVDLSNFDTSKVTDMNYMFFNNWSLTSVNLNNFDTSKVNSFYNMFNHCRSLKSINLYSFTVKSSISSIFYNTSDSLIYCYDENKASYLSTHLSSKIRGKYVIENKMCIEDCYDDNNYKFEYQNKCLIKCPLKTKNINYKCQDLNCDIYNYEQNDCISVIEDGYFLNDSIAKTIDKCDQDRKTCEKKGTNNNSNCKSCKDNKYLYYGNCIINCPNGYYIDDNLIKICKCDNNKCFSCPQENIELCFSCNLG